MLFRSGLFQPFDLDLPVGGPFTDVNGHYQFVGLSPGSYWVSVPGGYSAPGQSLFGLVSSPNHGPADNDVDNDDSGRDQFLPIFNQIASTLVTLLNGTEPDSAIDGDGPDSNQTVDFGFFAPPLTILAQPQSLIVSSASVATLSVLAVANPPGPVLFQWQRDGVDIPGATDSTYTTPVLAIADNGARFSALVAAGGVTLASAEAVLTEIGRAHV